MRSKERAEKKVIEREQLLTIYNCSKTKDLQQMSVKEIRAHLLHRFQVTTYGTGITKTTLRAMLESKIDEKDALAVKTINGNGGVDASDQSFTDAERAARTGNDQNIGEPQIKKRRTGVVE